MSLPWDQNLGPTETKFLHDLSFSELAQMVESLGFHHKAADNLFKSIHRHGVTTWDQVDTNRVSPKLIQRLAQTGPPLHPFKDVQAHPSTDGSVKFVYHLYDDARIESILMPFEGRATYCVSSQVGCALGCTFCATGAMGFRRHLTPGEMIGQVLHMAIYEDRLQGQRDRFNVVFMGMGEPLHNLANLLRAFDILTHSSGLVMSPKDVAVSTSGLVPRIRELAKRSPRPRLMVSIAATSDEARSAIMPVNRAYNLETLLQTLEAFPLQKRERIMLSYVLIADVNDRPEDAERLIHMSRRFPSLINLIPMNEHADSPDMREPDEHHVNAFATGLRDAGVFTTIRHSRGRDVAGACGQLALRAG